LIFKTLPRARARALLGIALAGSAAGLAAAFLAGASARAELMHERAQALATGGDVGFSETALKRVIDGMPPGALVIAQRHDPQVAASAAQRDRQAAAFAARLERSDAAHSGPTVASLMLRPSLGVGQFDASSRFDRTVIDPLDSARDLECLTQAVYYEARGESARGQAAVAQVVLNRVRHPAFPKTVCAVVFQGASTGHGCQFSFACDGSMHDRREPEAWRKAEFIAARALSGAVVAEVGKATHFHVVGLGTLWSQDMIRVAQVGMHVFYRFGHGGVSDPHVSADGLQTAQAAPAPAAAQPQPVLASLLATAPAGTPAKTEAPEAKDAAAPAAAIQPTAGPAAPTKAATPTA
jgi:spore germination cell wall hydrolase CwlJ-like protein